MAQCVWASAASSTAHTGHLFTAHEAALGQAWGCRLSDLICTGGTHIQDTEAARLPWEACGSHNAAFVLGAELQQLSLA